VLRWNASNVAVRQDPAGNLKPDKERSTERIDSILAGQARPGAGARRQRPVHLREPGLVFL
jgi:hypothetical protein